MRPLDQKALDYILKNYIPTGEKVAAIRYLREVTGAGLAEAKDAADKIFEDYQTKGSLADSYSYSAGMMQQVVDVKAVEDYILRTYTREELIPAIKYYREATGVGLAEAKTAVESLFGTTYVSESAQKQQEKNLDSDQKRKIGIRIFFILLVFVMILFALYMKL